MYKPVEVHFSDQRRKNEVYDTIANIDKIRDKLNWKPSINIDEGIDQIVMIHGDWL